MIRDVESVGFNKKYVLATSKNMQELRYWRIDKMMETEKLGYEENFIMELSNVSKIDSTEFYHKTL